MALSPNYGWSEPDNSSLVKNGASDIRTLGDAIDTSVWNVGFGQAGKNAIINGDFGIWQRGAGAFTTSNYSSDRWTFYGQGSGTSHSATRETFTPGTAPVAGYEGTFFYRDVITSGSDATTQMILIQKIEDVRKFAGQTVTVSFWAKANTGTPKVGMEFYQDFGAGGSGAVSGTGQSVTISTSWARYSATFAVPSVSGKTIGTGSSLFLNLWMSAGSSSATRSGSVGLQSATFDFWGVQVEYGSKATPFRTATGTIQGELAACQRYYWRSTPGTAYAAFAMGGCQNANNGQFYVTPPVPMRTVPTTVDYSGIMVIDAQYNGGGTPSLAIGESANFPVRVYFLSATGLTGNAVAFLRAGNNTTAYFGLGAEL